MPQRSIAVVLRRELRVAFSRRTQPMWIRIAKWIVFIAVALALYGTRWFWPAIVGLPVLGVLVHVFYRKMTHNWTRPWGGWNDLEAGRPESRPPRAS